MKYIVQQKETERLLQQWTGPDRTLVIAHFFFWKPGNHLQKSREGLVRSLLRTILERIPGLIPAVFPEYWHSTGTPDWQDELANFEKVQAAFHRLTKESEMFKGHCFCLFIDGLDEFEEREQMQNHRLFAKTLQG